VSNIAIEPQPIPPVDLTSERAELGEEFFEVAREVLGSNGYVLGPHVTKFEEDFAAYQHAKYGIGVGSGTDALVLALKAFGVGPGDGVVTSPFTFFASAGTIAWVGGTPQLCDVEEDTGLLDLEQAKAAITPSTKCLLPVHIYGQLADVRGFRALADEHGIPLLEDAAQAHGAERDGLRAGEVGDAAAFSFYPTKNLGAAGEGGAILCNSEELRAQLLRLRDHGSSAKYVHTEIGTNSRLQALQGAILNLKLPRLDGCNARRRATAAAYDAAFAKCDAVTPLAVRPNSSHAYHQYVVRVQGDVSRDRVLEGLHKSKISAALHYPRPVHAQAAADAWGYKLGDFPVAEKLCDEVLCLPVHPFLKQEQVERVIAEVIRLAEGPREV
jgi:dTDP-4-amino-4,6-dideoxygalactose transaminase